MTNQQVEQPAPSIGMQLRAAREQQGLTHKEVGRQLKLPASLIEALEDDRTDDIAPVYLNGYLRSYSRLLQLDVQGMNSTVVNAGSVPELQLALPAGRGYTWLEHAGKVAGYLVVTAFVVAPLVWWFTQGAVRLSFDESLVSANQDVPLSINAQASGDNQNESGAADQANEDTPAEDAHLQASAAPFIALRNTETQPVPAEPMQDDVVMDDVEQSIDSSIADDGQVEEQPEAAVGMDQLRLHMLNDSWVEITDADGERLEYDLLSAGRVRAYAGKAPFRLLFGRASAVELYLNDEYIDMSPYTRGNVANTTLASNRPVIEEALTDE